MAEGAGFEPAVRYNPYDGLVRVGLDKPLSQNTKNKRPSKRRPLNGGGGGIRTRIFYLTQKTVIMIQNRRK